MRSLSVATCALILCAAGLSAQPPLDVAPKLAPAFVRNDLSGKKISLEKYRGKVVLLDFWATWCAGCQVELPKFATWQKKYGSQGFSVLAVSMDDTAAPVRKTVQRLRLNFPVVMGDAQLGDQYGGLLGLPVTYLIDRQGKILATFKGDADLSVMEHHVQAALRQ